MTSLAFMNWPTVAAYLKKRTDIILPIGSIEQHGPNGLIGTDALIAEALAKSLGERIGACVGPTISVGMAQHHLAFPGSITLRPITLIAVIEDMVLSLARAGFTHFHFINGHGGNTATVEAAFAQIHARSSVDGTVQQVCCRISNYFELSEVQARSFALYGRAGGMHATASEIAMTMHLYPGKVEEVMFDPEIAPKGRTFGDAESYRRAYPDGRIGSNPALANASDGADLFNLSIAALVCKHQSFVEDCGHD